MQRLVATLQRLHDDSIEIFRNLQDKFPVEIELSRVAGVAPKADDNFDDDDDDDDVDDELEYDDEGIFEPKPVNNETGNKTTENADDLLLDLG